MVNESFVTRETFRNKNFRQKTAKKIQFKGFSYNFVRFRFETTDS